MREARSNSSRMAVTSSTGSDSRVIGISQGVGVGASESDPSSGLTYVTIRLDKSQLMVRSKNRHAERGYDVNSLVKG